MKHITCLLVSLLAVFMLSAQTVDTTVTDVSSISEVLPSFPGGEIAMFSFLSKNIKYPDYCRENGIEGEIVLAFIVDKTGIIRNAHVVKSVPDGELLEQEALRIVATMPKWTPGTQDGNAVNVNFRLPLKFRLDDGEEKEDPNKIKIKPSEDGTYTWVAEMPKFSSVDTALQTYIKENLNLAGGPKMKQGIVFVKCLIDADGSVKRASVYRNNVKVGTEYCAEEALRLVKGMPKWVPGKHKGKALPVWTYVQVYFEKQP